MAGDAHNPALLTIEPTTAATYSDVTLRDLFAAAALTGLRANQASGGWSDKPEKIAEYAYRDADAMLAERAKEQTDGR
jgi:hypothetical protein